MAQEEGKQEEKFDFTREGETLGYISLDQARILAMQTAREAPGDYGTQFVKTNMAFEVVADTETEDHYVVTLSFRPQGQFSGRPGREQFFIEKGGAVVHRQVLSLPGPSGWRRYRFALIIMGLVLVLALAFIATRDRTGSDESVALAVALPTSTPETFIATPASGPIIATPEPRATARPPRVGPTSISNGLRRGVSISGRVTDAETGLPIANIEFGAESGPKFEGVDSEDISGARTDDGGNYVFRGLPADIIRIHVHDTQGYIVQDGDIRTETVGPGEELEGVDFSFKRGATISGRVTDVDTGLPITDVTIGAERDREGTGYSDAQTGDDGRYTLGGLTPGDYVISTDRDTKGYIRELYDDKYTWGDAARIAVTRTEEVQGIDFGLKQGATISGTVVDAESGLPIANMDVQAAQVAGDDISSSETDRDGRYTLKGIPNGVIEVFVAGQGYLQTSKTVTVRDGQHVTDFDF